MRDFRDAKAMARALRDALKAKSVETTHTESLELIAKAFGYENWNILSARIEAQPRGPDGRAPSAAGMNDPAAKGAITCSFCSKTEHETKTMIAGPPPLFICNECIGLCSDVLDDQEVLDPLEAGAERGHQSFPAALEYVRGRATEQLTAYVECGRKGAERHRFALQSRSNDVSRCATATCWPTTTSWRRPASPT